MTSFPVEQPPSGSSGASSLHSHSYSGSHHALPGASSIKGSMSTSQTQNPAGSSQYGTSKTAVGIGYSVGSGGSTQESLSSLPNLHRESGASLADGISGGGVGGSSANGASGSFIGANTSAYAATGASGVGGAEGTSQLLIASIVQRLVKRLPHNTGEALVRLERSTLIRSSVANLVRYSQFQLAVVLREILQVLDTLNKTAQSMADERVSANVMQSQLFMLHVLVACLIHSWKTSIKGEGQSMGGKRSGGEDAPNPASAQSWPDPPPLDDALAKQVLSVMTYYIRQTASREDELFPKSSESKGYPADKAKGRDDEANAVDGSGAEGTSLASLALTHGTGLFVLYPVFPPKRQPFEIDNLSDTTRPPLFTTDLSQSDVAITNPGISDPSENPALLAQSIFRQAGQVIFFLSSSNWQVVFARIRNRLTYLSTTAEESPNSLELRLLECSNLQRARLGVVLQELCTSFMHLKRSAQQILALVVRRMIWSWIQYHPAEYATLFASGRRMEGAPDALFDQVAPLAESTRKKHIFWPMLTSLLIICPDVINKIAIGESRKGSAGMLGGSLTKKSSFLDALRKGLRNSRLSDISTLCCVDICRAATNLQGDESGLRLIAGELEAEVQERVFDVRRATYYSPSSNDVPLMTDALVVSFRLDPQKVLKEVLPTLMNDAYSIVFRIVLVKALTIISSERERLPWQADVSLFYPFVCSSLRSIAGNNAYRLHKSDTSLSDAMISSPLSTTKKLRGNKYTPQDDMAGRHELLSSLLQFWIVDKTAIFYGMDDNAPVEFVTLGKGGTIFDDDLVYRNALQLDGCMSFLYIVGRIASSHEMRHAHVRAGRIITAAVDRRLDDQSIKSLRLFQCCLSLTTTFSRRLASLLSASNTPQQQQHWLLILSSSLQRKFSLYGAEEASNNPGRGGSVTPPASKAYLPRPIEMEWENECVEKALLLTICSVDTYVCSAGLQACNYFARYRTQASHLYDYSSDWTKLYAELGRQEAIQTGRIAQQKRIRACLREASSCSYAVLQAWREAYARWSNLTLIVARPMLDDANDSAQEQAAQWHNYAGFLSALGGSCAVDHWPSPAAASVSTNSNAAAEQQEAPLQYVETFVQEMVDLLVSDSIWVREKAKEILGSDFSPRLNGILLRMIHSVLSDFFDKSTGQPRPTEVYTVFVEHSISVIQMVLTRMTEPSEATVSVDIGALMVLYVEYLNAIPKREQAARVRTSMCLLCESFMLKRSFFSFSNEVRVRNRLFQVLCGWTSESIEEPTSSTERLDRLQRELDISCLRIMTILLDKLPLLLPEDSPIVDETVDWAKSRHFSTYFTYFIKVLNRAQAIDRASAASLSNHDNGTGMESNPSQSTMRGVRDPALRDVGPVKQSAIMALSNLLAANIDTGLHQSLPLAYQEDVQLRTAFMQIMTNVLNQGTAFDQLERFTAAQKPNKLIDLICESDMQLALSLCNVCKGYDDGGMDYILLNIFDSRGGIIRFLKAALFEEVERTLSEEMVFRSNSFRTHLLSAFGRTHGYEYLRSIIAPLINDMNNKPRGYSFEIDAQKHEPGENVIVNQHRLEETAQAFIDQICSSAHRVPAVLRELCRHIRQLMDRRFPASRYQGVGGFIFLRFINPAIVAPQIIDINMSTSSKEVRRGLLLVSKILQTLASNTLFPQHKEPFMTRLNDFLKRNVWKITAFLDQVSDTRTDPDRLAAADQPLGFGIHPFGYGLDNDDQVALHRFMYENVDKIGKDLLTRTTSATVSSLDSPIAPTSREGSNAETSGAAANVSPIDVPAPLTDGKKIYEQLCIVLAEMGDYRADDTNAGLILADGKGQQRPALQDFMRKYQGKNVDDDAYKAIFREGPPSKADRPVFYLTLFKLSSQTFDFESFIYYVLQTMQSTKTRPYDLLFDCTNLLPANAIPHQWINYFCYLLPNEIAANLRNVIGFNVNTACNLWMRPWRTQNDRLGSIPRHTGLSQVQSNVNLVNCNSIGELEAYIDRRNIVLDPVTVSISTAKEEQRLDDITMIWYYRSLIPVTFRLSEDYLQILSLKSVPILNNTPVFLNEVIHMAEIDDVRAINMRGDDNTFYITCRGGVASFLFISRNRADVVQALRQAKARVSRFASPSVPRRTSLERTLRPNDVPGTLLNMAMLNLTSQDLSLRLSAYDLLCALSSSFNFGASRARKRLLSAKGIVLSANTMNLNVELSRDFAIASPGVTLEFLTSFFEGFERADISQKTLGLQYMAPWLANLVMFTHTSRDQQREYQKRIKGILTHLIAITVKERDMYANMQRSVWSQFSKMDDLIPILIDVFAEVAMDFGLHTERFEIVLDTMISFSSINLRGKLLARLRRAITKTAQNPTVSQLHENAAWKEIATLARMNLALSFTNRLETQLYLPELLQLTLLLAGTGETATRFAVHGTAVNLIHSLCTEHNGLVRLENRSATTPATGAGTGARVRPAVGGASDTESATGVDEHSEETRSSRLEALLHRLSEDEYLALFGLPAANGNKQALLQNATSLSVRESPSNQDIAKLASTLYEVIEVAAPTIDAANAWRSRLTSLVTSKAFQYNPIIQSRAFILLGQLAELTRTMLEAQATQPPVLSTQPPPMRDTELPSPSPTSTFEVDDDLLYQILVSLRGSIQEWATMHNDSPIVSIVVCLSKVVQILPNQSRYLAPMFWLGISIIQYGHIPLFKSGVELMNATVETICARNLLESHHTDLVTFLLDGRFEFRDAACRLDDETGVDFEINFGFGMAALLVKGLRHPSTREATIELLETMLRSTATNAEGRFISSEGKVSNEQLGFFIALLPTALKPDEFGRLLSLAGVSPALVEQAIDRRTKGLADVMAASSAEREALGLYTYLSALENKIALLVIALLSALLQHSDNAEKQILYLCLADSARRFPAIVSIVYDYLLPNMREVYLNSQDEDIVRSIDVIGQVAIAEPIFQLQVQETKRRGGAEAYLDESGYACLLDCGNFTPLKDARRVALAQLSTTLLSGLIDAGSP